MDINVEIDLVIQVVNDITFNRTTFGYICKYTFNDLVNFLLHVVQKTIKYPRIELYLDELLPQVPVNNLENLHWNTTILHLMASLPHNISLNAFEMMINHGLNINARDTSNKTVITYFLGWDECDLTDHVNNIMKLFIRYGADLNVVDRNGRTLLDKIIHCEDFNREIINCVTTLIDAGAKNNKADGANVMAIQFIESYSYQNIKPAIK